MARPLSFRHEEHGAAKETNKLPLRPAA